VGTLRHTRQRHGVDGRSIRPLLRGRAAESHRAVEDCLSPRGSRWVLERRRGGGDVHRAGQDRCLMETSGSAAAEERLVHDRCTMARFPPRAPRDAAERGRDVSCVEQRGGGGSVLASSYQFENSVMCRVVVLVAFAGCLTVPAGSRKLEAGSSPLARYESVEPHM